MGVTALAIHPPVSNPYKQTPTEKTSEREEKRPSATSGER